MNPVFLDCVDFSWPGAERPLFENVNMAFPCSHITAIIGPNGSGKTTLLELVLGWRQPSRGKVVLNGRSAGEIPVRERGQLMALVPQEERMPFAYSVLEYILLGRSPYLSPLEVPGVQDRAEAAAVLDSVGIGALALRKIDTLSGGEKRLVLVARALVQKPQILLLDEPGNHLDPANRERIKVLLRRLHKDGTTIIFSSHEPDLVSSLAQYIVLLKPGRTPVMGPVDAMLVPEKLSALYDVPVQVVGVKKRRIILWGS